MIMLNWVAVNSAKLGADDKLFKDKKVLDRAGVISVQRVSGGRSDSGENGSDNGYFGDKS